ncbi:MAG TPA: peptidyl-prolyl cis-trans isomerase [Thermoanaerobaculia bacterium]|nr:peptidyl-prolyl cis-trans isomerase [Thermoanaerobaculia bacterium]
MRRFAVLLLLASIALACNRRPVTPPDVVARVGDRMLTLADYKRYLERNAGTDLAQLQPEVASALLDQYIEEVILSEYAARSGVEVPAEAIASAVRSDAGATVIEKRDEMRRQRLIASVSAELPEPSEAQIREYYEKRQGEFRSGEEVRVRQILVHDEALANDIAAKLRKGASFETLSAEHSQAPNAKRGGEIGFVSRGELPKMFEEQIFSLQPGQVSPVIRTDKSFHIFKVDEHRPPGVLSLEGAAPAIRARLRDDAVRDHMAQLGARARREMPIAVLTKRLPFRYSGTLPKSENE